jgi:predicted TIM-barrel fold metal-dependent hydrolase
MLSAAAAGLVVSPRLLTQSTSGGPRIIDTHHHIYPPKYTANNLKRIVDDAWDVPSSVYTDWTPRYSLDQMDQNGVATAIVSITSPGVWFGNNEEGARMLGARMNTARRWSRITLDALECGARFHCRIRRAAFGK